MPESQLSLFSLASTRHAMKTIIAMSFLAVLCTMAHAQDPVKTKPAEIWLKVDPGQYIIICWNSGHAKTTPVHPFTVEEVGARDNRPPKEGLVLKLFDFRFELDGTLHQGTQVTRIETPWPQHARGGHLPSSPRQNRGRSKRLAEAAGPWGCTGASPGRCTRQS